MSRCVFIPRVQYNKLKQFPVVTKLIINDSNKIFNVDTQKKTCVETAVSLLGDSLSN
jgi:hypothetical protein